MRIYGWELFAVCHHHDKSCNHKYYDSGNMFLIHHETSREHMFKGLCEFIGGSFSRRVTTLPYLIAIDLMQLGIKYLIYPVISQKHVIESSCSFMSRSSSWYVTTLPNLMVIGVVEI